MSFHKYVLPNGLTIVGEVSPSARSVAVGFFVKTGSRDETPEESGVSHFLEHMVFKGTPKRSALQVNIDFDKIGASPNAFTSEENTVFHAAVLPEYLPQAVDILTDILRPSLRGDDFDMEKKVIIEEIGMYDDQPSWCAYDNARKAFFADHPLGNSVLGTADSITALSREQMLAYFDRRYVAPNIIACFAGKIDFDAIVKLVEKHCGDWPTGKAPRENIRPVTPRSQARVITKESLSQEQVFMLCPAPAVDSPLRYPCSLLDMVVGDSTGSRFYWALVDPGFCDSADMSYHENEGAGAYYISFSCEPERTAENVALVREILHDVQQNGVSEEELAVAKSKFLSRMVRASERPMRRMVSVGMNWNYLHEYRSVDEELERIDAVTLKDLRIAIDQYPFGDLTVLALGPLAKLD